MAWAELSDVRCYYELLGEGEPLLLIPGLGANCRVWDPVVPLITRFHLEHKPEVPRDEFRTAHRTAPLPRIDRMATLAPEGGPR